MRDAETLEFLGFAPVFDCGTSLRYDTPAAYIEPDLNVESQPFCSFHEKPIGLVSDIKRFDLDRLSGIEQDIAELLSDGRAAAYINGERRDKIIEVVRCRIGMLERKM